MRILYSFDNFMPMRETDTEQVANTVAALARCGAQVELVIPRRAGAVAPTPAMLRDWYSVRGEFAVSSIAAPLDALPGGRKVAHAAAVTWRARAATFDVFYTRNIPTLLAAAAAGHPVVYETYRPWPSARPALRPLFRRAMARRGVLGFVLHSELARRSYVGLGLPDDRLAVVHNGYDPARQEPRLTRQEARAKLGLGGTRPLVVYAGRMNARKGLDVVLDMARRCCAVDFLLVGSEGEGPVEREARIVANVKIAGWQRPEAVAQYLYAADVLVIPPSLAPLRAHGNTVLPMKLFQYLAAGRPLLAPRAPDTAELLRDDVNAALVPPDDAAGAAAALLALLDDRARADRLAAAALATSRDLTWDRRGERILALLEAWRAGCPG